MTKADIAEKIHTTTGLSKKDSAAMMESVFVIMKESLEAGETIKVSGFGSFIVNLSKPLTPGWPAQLASVSEKILDISWRIRFILI
jgi:nucleoid DNA-binding protein